MVARSVHPEYRQVLETYTKHQGIPLEELGYAKNGLLDLDDLRKKFERRRRGGDCAIAKLLRTAGAD